MRSIDESRPGKNRRTANASSSILEVDADSLERLTRALATRISATEYQLLQDEPLKANTTLQIGGPADLLIHARSRDATQIALSLADELNVPALLLGGGSNVLASDVGWRGIAVHVACEEMQFADGECLVEAGADFLEFIQACSNRGLSGLEFAAGVPGGVGGAIYGNAGCYGKAIGEFLIEADICDLDGSNRRVEPVEFFEFEYRTSRLKRDPKVILAARIRLSAAPRESIQEVIDARLDERRVKHPDLRTEPTAGSYFKNLPPEKPGAHRVPAGRVLDQAACRGLRVGDAAVFSKHANIIVNQGNATAQEVLTLAEVMKTRARSQFGVELHEEVLFVGQRPQLIPHPELGSPPPPHSPSS